MSNEFQYKQRAQTKDYEKGWVKVFGEKLNSCNCFECLRELDETDPISDNPLISRINTQFVVCPECGNKRCPKGSDHRNPCTNSNEPNQNGSRYFFEKQP